MANCLNPQILDRKYYVKFISERVVVLKQEITYDTGVVITMYRSNFISDSKILKAFLEKVSYEFDLIDLFTYEAYFNIISKQASFSSYCEHKNNSKEQNIKEAPILTKYTIRLNDGHILVGYSNRNKEELTDFFLSQKENDRPTLILTKDGVINAIVPASVLKEVVINFDK